MASVWSTSRLTMRHAVILPRHVPKGSNSGKPGSSPTARRRRDTGASFRLAEVKRWAFLSPFSYESRSSGPTLLVGLDRRLADVLGIVPCVTSEYSAWNCRNRSYIARTRSRKSSIHAGLPLGHAPPAGHLATHASSLASTGRVTYVAPTSATRSAARAAASCSSKRPYTVGPAPDTSALNAPTVWSSAAREDDARSLCGNAARSRGEATAANASVSAAARPANPAAPWRASKAA